MALSITDTEITSNVVPDIRAYKVSLTEWAVATFPKFFDRNQAITAMSLVELRAEGIATGADRMLAKAWLDELRLPTSDHPPMAHEDQPWLIGSSGSQLRSQLSSSPRSPP